MRKIIPLSLALTLLLTWGTVWAIDGNTEPALDQAGTDIVPSLTTTVKPEVTVRGIFRSPKQVVNNPIFCVPQQQRMTLTVWLFDDFEDGDFTNNPTWTPVSNGNGNGTEDWAIYSDPWNGAYWYIENHGSGYFAGSDSDGGGALADEELSVDFSTPEGGQLTLSYWLWFRAYDPAIDYFEVLIDGEQIDLVEVSDDVPIVGVRSVIIDDYADGNMHTLTMHYYSFYGYACAIDHVLITDKPCEYLAGDCDHNGTPVELSDVIAMISMYRGAVDPYYTCDCPPHGIDFAPEADPNGNCIALELSDVVTEIGVYRGTVEASGCADCPGLRR